MSAQRADGHYPNRQSNHTEQGNRVMAAYSTYHRAAQHKLDGRLPITLWAVSNRYEATTWQLEGWGPVKHYQMYRTALNEYAAAVDNAITEEIRQLGI